MAKGDELVATIGVGDAHRDSARLSRMAIDAFVREIQSLAGSIEQVPKLGGRELALRVGVGREVGKLQSGLAPVEAAAKLLLLSVQTTAYPIPPVMPPRVGCAIISASAMVGAAS